MKNIIFFFTLILCVTVSTVNAQKASKSKSITFATVSVAEEVNNEDNERAIAMMQEEFSPEGTTMLAFAKVANVIEDVDTQDAEVRCVAMTQEEINPETATTILAQVRKVNNVTEDINTKDAYLRKMAMMQDEFSPEAPETNIARNADEVTAKY